MDVLLTISEIIIFACRDWKSPIIYLLYSDCRPPSGRTPKEQGPPHEIVL